MGMRIRSVYHSGLIALDTCMDNVGGGRDCFVYLPVHLREAGFASGLGYLRMHSTSLVVTEQSVK